MPRQPMYRKGKQIKSLDRLFKLLDDEDVSNGWVYYDGVPKHPQWILSMSIRALGIAVEDGRMHEAVANRDRAKRKPTPRKGLGHPKARGPRTARPRAMAAVGV